MNQSLFRKLLLAGLLFLPSSALFAILSIGGETYVAQSYIDTADNDLRSLRAALESEWAQTMRVIGAFGESPLIQPTGRLDTISAALRSLAQSSILVRHASLFGHEERLIASTNKEFLTFSAEKKGAHPGIAQWPLQEPLLGKTVMRLSPGDYESYYLLPIKNQTGTVHGVLAIEIDTSRLVAMATGLMSSVDVGYRLSIDDLLIAEQGTVANAATAKSTSFWGPTYGDYIQTTKPISFGDLGSISITVVRDFAPAQRLVDRVRLFVLGTSCLTAVLFFLGILWTGRTKPTSFGPSLETAGDIRIMPISLQPSPLEYAVPERPDEDRKAS